MRSPLLFDRSHGFEDLGAGVAGFVALVEEPGSNHALPIDDEGAGVGDSVDPASGRLLVPDTERFDDLAVRVGQERKLDATLLSETTEDFDTVVAHGRYLNAFGLQVLQVFLQLN